MKQQSSKSFLSENPDEFGSIGWVVKDYYGAKPTGKCASITLTDCYKRIDLDFEYDSFKEYEARCEKIDTLINELQAFRQAFRDSWGVK